MHENYGNVVVLAGTDFKSKYIMGPLMGSIYHHSGLLIEDEIIDVMTQRGVRPTNIKSPAEMEEEEYGNWLILEHKKITPEIRERIRWVNEKKFRNLPYDNKNIYRLIPRCLTGKFDNADISSGGLYCHSRIGHIYAEAGFPVKENIHPSQLIVPHFFDNFRIIFSSS